jgi:penicillin-binding protein 2
MTAVPPKDLTKDSLLNADDLRGFVPGDQVGDAGLERLAEPLLRGTRGEESLETGQWKETIKPVPGKDVHTTIDRDLQRDVAGIFNESITIPDDPNPPQTFANLHGAAIVLKIDTNENQVLAMYSNPGFDLNRFDENFAKLRQDNVNKPLLNRATQQAFQPGSAVKTIIGSVAVTRHVLTPHEGIECTGYLRVPDRAHPGKIITFEKSYRCWTMMIYHAGHHTIPSDAPHKGLWGNPDGFLCLSDALERSCNVYFETVADRLRLSGTVDALQTFGLGRPTGIGIAESTGTLPPAVAPRGKENDMCWRAGIGEGDVSATPIQMATVAATIARNGIWMRPRLLMGDGAEAVEESQRATGRLKTPDSVDLHLDPQGLAAVHEGMVNVVNHPLSGTGPQARREEFTVAGKTGSAQIDQRLLRIPVLDENGEKVHGPDSQGHPGKGPLLITAIKPNQYPWIQGTGEKQDRLAHAWFIGFAPAENPRVAFCVLVEYGGSGGKVAGPIAQKILGACLAHHYLEATHAPAQPTAALGDANQELLHPQ